VQVHDRDMFALLAHADSLYFPPGTHFRYSNTGYALLALVVEKASGMPFARFLHDRIFAPLGMTATVAYESGVSTVPHRAYGYTQHDSAFQPTDQSPTSAVLGDGGVYTSVADLVKWDHALETNAIVSAASQQLAWTPPVLPAGAPTKYGFGWFIDSDGGRRRLYHHGETSGFTNFILRYPEQRLTVIVLTNRNGGEPWTIGQKVADLFLGTVSGIPEF
ncbi:MAG: serine hydrolase domain-containing protein, partial [Gemmatimonadaceae bacterium]